MFQMDPEPPILFFMPTGVLPPDFVFYIDGEEYPVHRVTAATLSPKLASMLKENKDLNSYSYNNIKDPHKYFQLISDAFHGRNLMLNPKNAPFIFYIANDLDIQMLKAAASQFLKPVTRENAIEILSIYGEMRIPHVECADLLAENFEDFQNRPEFLKMPINAYEQIFESDKFQIADESVLFDFIVNVIKNNTQEYSILFSLQRVENLEPKMVEQIIEHVSYNSVDPEIIKTLLYRLSPN